MAELTLFTFGSNPIRVVTGPDGEPWAVAADVCAVLAIVNVGQAVERLDQADICKADVPNANGQTRSTWIINEIGAVQLIARSNRPEARPLSREIARVFVEYRKGTLAPRLPQTFSEALQLAADQARELETARPKIEAAERWLESEDSIHIVEWAKKFGMTQSRMYQLLRDRGVLFKQRHDRDFMHAPKAGYEECFDLIQEWVAQLKRHVPVCLVTPVGQERLARELGLI